MPPTASTTSVPTDGLPSVPTESHPTPAPPALPASGRCPVVPDELTLKAGAVDGNEDLVAERLVEGRHAVVAGQDEQGPAKDVGLLRCLHEAARPPVAR